MSQILLIEDEPDISLLIQTILTPNGFEIIKASSGEEGQILASKLKPDLIILDLVMPGLSGHKVCRLLKTKKDTKDIPVINSIALNRDIDRKYAKCACAKQQRPIDTAFNLRGATERNDVTGSETQRLTFALLFLMFIQY